jgi:2-C-methyl-D-erythritol 4-phosphate cytidylyltransferase
MGQDKLWSDVNGKPLFAYTLAAAVASRCFDAVVIAAPRERWDDVELVASGAGVGGVQLVEGGERRQDSVRNALAASAGHTMICVHDAARPLVTAALIEQVLAAARDVGAATAAIPCSDTIKAVAGGVVSRTLERDGLVATQTPQAFRAELLLRAHEAAVQDHVSVDDDAALVERIGAPVAVVPGEMSNLKVTYPHDLDVVRALLQARR